MKVSTLVYCLKIVNLYREVVVVFSNYKSFEPRSLDAVDELNIQELRLEEICYIIISKDDEVSKKIDQLQKSLDELKSQLK